MKVARAPGPAKDGRLSQFVYFTTNELGHRLSGARAQDLGLIGSMIGGLIGVIAVVGVEDAQGW